MTNRRRPIHQRLLRSGLRRARFRAILQPSPLSLLAGVTLLAAGVALFSGCPAPALVLAASSFGSLARQIQSASLGLECCHPSRDAKISNCQPKE
ncbi:hypothetical protein [Parvibaculum sp.]|uniref:hypothetical protein n=1 Tax=Parvibaculum sp. TaxID=2024848 RepID=UPI003BAAFFDF